MLLDAIDRAAAPEPAGKAPRKDAPPPMKPSSQPGRVPTWVLGTPDAWARFNAVADQVA